jgi:hypothetical protein
MKKILLAATAAAALSVAPAAHAADFIVTGGSYQGVPGNNDFKSFLATQGLVGELVGANVSLPNAVQIKFEFIGSESGYYDSFYYTGVSSVTPLYSETSPFIINNTASPLNLGSYSVAAGAFLALFKSNGYDASSAQPGQVGFTVFTDASGNYDPNNLRTFYFGYDDIPNGDDNHDDIIIKATIVPEPATWALMIAGIAAVGVSMRRRSQNVRVAFS